VLVHHIVTLSRANDNNPDFCSEQKIGGADHVTHVFDEKDIDQVKREMFGSMFHEVSIKMALFASIGVLNRDSKSFDPFIVIISEYITCNRRGSSAPFREQRDYPFDEGGLS